eukprot:11674524-Karenia_brevis.AAC.1
MQRIDLFRIWAFSRLEEKLIISRAFRRGLTGISIWAATGGRLAGPQVRRRIKRGSWTPLGMSRHAREHDQLIRRRQALSHCVGKVSHRPGQSSKSKQSNEQWSRSTIVGGGGKFSLLNPQRRDFGWMGGGSNHT